MMPPSVLHPGSRAAPHRPRSGRKGRAGRAGRAWLLALAPLVLAAGLSAQPVPPPPAWKPALRSFAATVFRTAASTAATVALAHVRTLDKYLDGFVYDTFEVELPGRGPLGRVTRLRVHSNAGSTLDLAVSHEGSRVTSICALEPVVFSGKPFDALPRFTAALTHREAADYAVGLSEVFAALPLAVKAATQTDVEVSVPPKPGQKPLMVLSQPALEMGQRIPAFVATDLSGQPVRSGDFGGHWSAFVFGELQNSMSCDMLRAVARLLKTRPGVRLVAVAREPPEDVRPLIAGPELGKLKLGSVVCDADGRLLGQFHAPILPYLFVFDSDGKLAYMTFWRGWQSLGRELDLLREMK